MPQRQLGELMTELGLISDEQLATVLEVQQQSKRPLGQIIVELGFASGAAVAHALAMQSGGALKTEYGFALGVPPKDEDGDAETTGTLPKLRLAPTAVAPPRTNLDPVEDAETENFPVAEASEKPAPFAAPATETEPEHVESSAELEQIEDLQEVEEIETSGPVETEAVAVEPEESPDAEPEHELEEAETTPGTPLAVETDSLELDPLRAEIERLEASLAETQAVSLAQQERLRGEAASTLETAVADAKTEHEHELARLQADKDEATTELERLRTALAETQTERTEDLTRLQEERDQATAELERLRTTLAETQTERTEDLTRLQEEREEAAAELERLQNALGEAETAAAEHEGRRTDEQERHSFERDELTAQLERLREDLENALERLAAAGPAVEERDRLRAEAGQFESTLAETQAAATAEQERLLSEVDRLENALAETQTEGEQELARLGAEHERDREELERLQVAAAEAHASAAEQERRLAEEQERHAGERDEFNAQRERLQEELGSALERLAALGAAAKERDELRSEVERLEQTLAEVRANSAVEQRAVVEERDALTAELDEARELLRQAERVRESQIALEAERDRALGELERLETVAADAHAEAQEHTRLLAEEQDRHLADRETLLAQRTLLEQELGSAIEQLAAAASASDEQEQQLQLRSHLLLDSLDAVRGLAAELVTRGVNLAEAETDDPQPPTEDAADETESAKCEPESEEVDYLLFVPGPNGYELVPQTGIPPQPGQTVELIFPEREEPAVFEVVRSGRTLPGGDVCVYLAQV